MDTKLKCSACLQNKEFDEFHVDKTTKRGYSYKCKICKKNGNNSIKKQTFTKDQKYCSKCNSYKDFDFFNFCKNCPKNLKYYCKQCESDLYYLNIEKIKIKQKNYRNENVDKIRLNKKAYYSKVKNKRNDYIKNRIKNDYIFSLKLTISKNINNKLKRFLKNKKDRNTFDILGCSLEEFITYLESKFEKRMTWDNKGLYNGEKNYGWDLDHIIPMCSAKTEDEIYKLNHYSNFQPLCSKINRDVKWKNINYYG